MRLEIVPANSCSPFGVFSVDVNNNAKIVDVKTKIMETTGIGVNDQVLHFMGSELMGDTTSVHYYGIQNGAIISLAAFHTSGGNDSDSD
jgi:Ubiquitin family